MPSADTPAGIGSSPTVGSRHAPSTERTGPPKPGWTTRSSMRLFGRFGVTVRRRPQVASGTPSGSLKSSSPELASVTRRSGFARSPDHQPGISRAGNDAPAGRGRRRPTGRARRPAGRVRPPARPASPEPSERRPGARGHETAAIAMVRSCRFESAGSHRLPSSRCAGRMPTHPDYTDQARRFPATPATRPVRSSRPAPGRSRSDRSCRRRSRRARHPPSGARHRCGRGPRGCRRRSALRPRPRSPADRRR